MQMYHARESRPMLYETREAALDEAAVSQRHGSPNPRPCCQGRTCKSPRRLVDADDVADVLVLVLGGVDGLTSNKDKHKKAKLRTSITPSWTFSRGNAGQWILFGKVSVAHIACERHPLPFPTYYKREGACCTVKCELALLRYY
jgi:hypothetical protein